MLPVFATVSGFVAILFVAMHVIVVYTPHRKQLLGNKTTHPIASLLKGLLSAIGQTRSNSARLRMTSLVVAAGEPLSLNATEILGLQPICAVILGTVSLTLTHSQALALIATIMGWLYPTMSLRGCVKRRQHTVRMALPFMLDLLAICMEAGLNFDSSISRVREVLQPGILKEELTTLNQEMRMGKTRRDSLYALAARLDMPEVTSLITTLVQADQMGTGMMSALPSISEHLRMRRLLAAESAVAKAPIKMLFPLIALIFPCLLVLLFGPMFLNGGLDF